jgi:hypothetical protein
LGFEIRSNLELGGSTVWNSGSTHVEEDNLRLQICLSLKSSDLTVWHLNPNALGGNLRLQICSSLKSSGSMIWHLNPNASEGNLRFEIRSNLELGDSTVWNSGSKHVEEDNLRLQICSSLKLSDLTVWHLNPNTSRRVIWDFKFVQVSNRVVRWFDI